MITIMEEPDEFLKALWDLNDKYPDYVSHTKFDHVSLPSHCMDSCKKHFVMLLEKSIASALQDITLKIEEAEEDGRDEERRILLTQRKQLKALSNIDLSSVQTIEDLESMKPEQLKPFWGK